MNNELEGMWTEAIKPISRHNSGIHLVRMSTSTKTFSQDIWCASQNSNQTPPKYMQEVLLLSQFAQCGLFELILSTNNK